MTPVKMVRKTNTAFHPKGLRKPPAIGPVSMERGKSGNGLSEITIENEVPE